MDKLFRSFRTKKSSGEKEKQEQDGSKKSKDDMEAGLSDQRAKGKEKGKKKMSVPQKLGKKVLQISPDHHSDTTALKRSSSARRRDAHADAALEAHDLALPDGHSRHSSGRKGRAEMSGQDREKEKSSGPDREREKSSGPEREKEKSSGPDRERDRASGPDREKEKSSGEKEKGKGSGADREKGQASAEREKSKSRSRDEAESTARKQSHSRVLPASHEFQCIHPQTHHSPSPCTHMPPTLPSQPVCSLYVHYCAIRICKLPRKLEFLGPLFCFLLGPLFCLVFYSQAAFGPIRKTSCFQNNSAIVIFESRIS